MAEQQKSATFRVQPAPRRIAFGARIFLPANARSGQFFSNLKDFLTERPVELRGSRLPFVSDGFNTGFWDNVGEWFRPLPRSAKYYKAPKVLLSGSSGLANLLDNFKSAFSTPKLPPVRGRVPEIGMHSPQLTRAQALSLAVHVAVIVLILVPLLPTIMSPPTTKAGPLVTPIADVSVYIAKLPPGKKPVGGGGGGGAHETLPASRGKLPKFSPQQLAPPSVRPPLHPQLAVTPTVLGPDTLKLPSPNAPNYGDPLAKILNNSNGPGGGSGIGTGAGTGVGSGSGGGVGPGNQWGTGGGFPRAGENGYGEPECLYCPNPQYSDEAVKAKYQGVVELLIVVTPDGRASQIRVVKGLGLGLDEKAIEAVRNYRFKPALGPDGRAAAVQVILEVTFRLY